MSASQFVLVLFVVVLIGGGLYLILPLLRPRSPTGSPEEIREDDQQWLLGVFYNNPGDPHVFVPKRFGLGWTVNIGHPLGRLFMFGVLLVPAGLAFLQLLVTGSITSYGCHPSGCNLLP